MYFMMGIAGPPPYYQTKCLWEIRFAMGISTVNVSWTAMLILSCFLNLIPGMAFVECTGNSIKPPKLVGKATFSVKLGCQKSRLQLNSQLCWASVEKARGTIILKYLFGWWLIRAVHHRETNPGVNRCLFWILQPVIKKKIRESTTGYSNLTCSAWEQQPTSPNLCPAA